MRHTKLMTKTHRISSGSFKLNKKSDSTANKANLIIDGAIAFADVSSFYDHYESEKTNENRPRLIGFKKYDWGD